MLFDYKVAETKFSGPTMFSRGDTTYINQRGQVICKQRSTSVRYLAENARKLGMFAGNQEKQWTDQELEDLEKQKMEYYQSFRDLGHQKRLFVKVGDALPTRPIGPHSIASFTTEWRSYLMTVWGRERGVRRELDDGGRLAAGDVARSRGREDRSRECDGLYKGPSRVTCSRRYAQLIGMPRGYGYGASMGAWVDRLPLELGWRMELHHVQQHAVPLARAHGRLPPS